MIKSICYNNDTLFDDVKTDFRGQPLYSTMINKLNFPPRIQMIVDILKHELSHNPKQQIMILSNTKQMIEDLNNKLKEFDWQKPSFPLIEDGIYKDTIEEYWKDKPVRFAAINNCVGCFNQNLILLRKRFDWHPDKMNWFIKQEELIKEFRNNQGKLTSTHYDKWKAPQTYEQVKNHKLQLDIFESDFNECDSGYCGL